MNLDEGGAVRPQALSEDELLAAIRKVLSGTGPDVLVGVGDDAAVVVPGSGQVLLTADMLVQGVHFDLALTSARDLGAKAIVANVSDIAAMGGSPRYALVSLAIPPGADPPWVVEMFGGMRSACDEYALSLVGGDLSGGSDLVVSVSVVGDAPPGHAMTRSGAKPGQRLVVTGSLGAAAGGLVLARVHPHGALTTEWGRALLDAHFRPAARVGEGRALAQAGAAAMIDVSDGLALDLSRLCGESGVGARVRLSDVPVAPELAELSAAEEVDPLELALSGGEDYELLAALDPNAVEPARERLGELFGTRLTEIGETTAEPEIVALDGAGNEAPLEPKGWDHFAPR